MIGARWVLLGAVLAGCIFTPRPMIPVADDDVDSAARDQDAAFGRDASGAADRGIADAPATPDDAVPPVVDAGAAVDAPVAAFDAGVPLNDAGGIDVGLDFDASAPSDAGGEAVDATVDCGARPDADDATACPDDAPDASTDGSAADAEVGLGGS